MREVTIEGTTWKVRSLKRKDLEKLKKYGFTVWGWKPNMKQIEERIDGKMEKISVPDVENMMKGQEKALKMIFGEKILDELDDAGGNKAIREVWRAVRDETWGNEEEEKNS